MIPNAIEIQGLSDPVDASGNRAPSNFSTLILFIENLSQRS